MKSTHFDVWEWADFVRGIGTGPLRSDMERHLSAGCQRCGRIVRVLRPFAEIASREAEYQPPQAAVRRAEALFPQRDRSRKGLVPRLIYDSFGEPLLAGMRAQDRLARHALYEAGHFFLDLQLEQEPSSGLISLVGQLTDRHTPTTSTAGVAILLTAGKGLVATATCNPLGEFQMEYRPARRLRLHVPLPDVGRHLDLGMDELLPVPLRRRTTARSVTRRFTRSKAAGKK